MISPKHAFTVLLLMLFCTPTFSQNDSCNLKISLLTCGPGEDLYSIFGHSAIRVQDQTSNTDVVFNYGTFDFEDPDFYIKFTRGKLLYFVAAEKFSDFVYGYQLENRSIIAQDLKLTCNEKERLFNALRINAREENKYYKYEFLFDNCSTRLRDIIAKNNDDSVTFKKILPSTPPTFRDMIHVYLDRGKQYWSEFGIDLVLASRIDRPVKNEEAMFLPDYLMKGIDSAVAVNESIVAKKSTILRSVPEMEESSTWFKPLTVTIILLVAGIFVTFGKKRWLIRAGNIFDATYFFILGCMGCFMLFMWFGTEHELCRDNYNLLWALPTHLIFAFLVKKDKSFVRKYFAVTAVISLLIVICWTFLPQGMNIAFLPLILVSGLRSAYRSKKK
jgi:hypothetical protein